MERREDIRAALQSLLSPGQRPDPASIGSRRTPAESGRDAASLQRALPLSDRQLKVLFELQSELREHGIKAEIPELVQVLLDELTARPDLCRALVAAYLS
ncbi:MAG TPA: hypothetical protein VNJ09_01915 [Chthonomonadales bacterium]|nr:hypothetical protein [Chthonomonadales bacterium]